MPESVNKAFTVNSLQVLLQEKLYNLEELFQNTVPEEIYNAIEEKEGVVKGSPIKLIRDEVAPPGQPEYYIKRTLICRSELDERIFLANTNHIFVVTGVTIAALKRANGFKEVARSGHLLCGDKINIRFIILENEQDFETICSKTSKPVHLIEYKNNAPFWVKSTKGLDLIRKFLKEEGELLEESDAVNKIIMHSFPAYCIAASPGMGKTMVLSSLASRMKEQKENAVVLFIHLPELMKRTDSISSISSSLQVITSFAGINYISELILRKVIEDNSKFQFFLFFDGYDEISLDKLEFADSFLRAITQLQNLVVIVVTRFYLQLRLENIFNRLSFEISPFNESNQVELLTKYWICRHSAQETTFLTQFAIKCLSGIEQLRKAEDGNIYEVPLLCLLLAEINAEDAMRVLQLNRLPEGNAEIFTLPELLRSLITSKFEFISDVNLRHQYMDAHVNEAIKLLFPQWLTKFSSLLRLRKNVEKNVMYSIGLIDKARSQNMSGFLHRIFADYFFANFIASNINTDQSCFIFLCKELFGRLGVITQEWRDEHTNEVERPTQYNLKHMRIAQFVNKHLQSHDYVWKWSLVDVTTVKEEDVCLAVAVCGSNNLEYCFEFLGNILQNIDIQKNQT